MPKGGGIYKVGSPYRIDGAPYMPAEDPAYDRTGVASFYSEDFHSRKTANGEVFDMSALTAAHPTLALLRPCDEHDERAHTAGAHQRQRPLRAWPGDRSLAASARLLGFEMQGTAVVRVRYAGRAPLNGDDHYEQRFLAAQH